MKTTTTKGFTLIELMIVIAIIGILASVALPSYQDYVTRAKITEALNIATELKFKINDYYKETLRFPANNSAAGVPEPQFLLGHYVQRVDVANGGIHVTFRDNAVGLGAQILTVRPLVVTGSPDSPVAWSCAYGSVPEGMEAVGENRTTVLPRYLPGSCQ